MYSLQIKRDYTKKKLGVLHRVARALSRLSEEAPFATTV
jgi:hypothetical protein